MRNSQTAGGGEPTSQERPRIPLTRPATASVTAGATADILWRERRWIGRKGFLVVYLIDDQPNFNNFTLRAMFARTARNRKGTSAKAHKPVAASASHPYPSISI